MTMEPIQDYFKRQMREAFGVKPMGTGPGGSCVIESDCNTCLFRPRNDPRIIGPCGNIEVKKTACSECYGKNKWQLDESL